MAALHDFNFGLERLSMLLLVVHRLSYELLELFHQRIKSLWYIASVDSLQASDSTSLWASVSKVQRKVFLNSARLIVGIRVV